MSKRSILLVRSSQENTKKENTADDFFSQLGEILKGWNITLSCEIVIYDKYLWFFLTCPKEVKDIVKGQWYSYYPHEEIEEVKDYTEKLFFSYNPTCFIGSELYYFQSESNSLKTYKTLEKNPLVALSGIASTFHKNEGGFIQLVLKPPEKETMINKVWKFIEKKEEKNRGSYFDASIRFLATGEKKEKTKLNLSSMISIYKKNLEQPDIQKLKDSAFYEGSSFLELYKARSFRNPSFLFSHKYRFTLSTSEIATFFHLPYKEEEITQIVQTKSKKAPPPQNLPKKTLQNIHDLAVFGETNYQNQRFQFGIQTNDRRRHLYVIGKTGMGKSKLLELLIREDINAGKGVILMDPHGDLSKEIINMIPENRIEDVIYFDPSDFDYPIGFNPMEGVGTFEFRQNIVNGFISIFKKMFGLNWNERFEHVLRYTTLALLEYPTASVLGIPRMLTDNLFRQQVIQYVSDPLVKKFWATEFSSWNDQFASEAIVPIINKIGQFVANPIIRNIVGQEKTGFSLEDVMNNGKILLANFAIGKLGEENSALLGSMLVTKVWQTAISRTSIQEEERKDCFMYVDEFQNFATTAFANILSEARKYRLNLTIAHQYMQQLPQEVRATIFGNIGNIISFRVGGEDAQILVKEFEPVFTVNDFLNLDMRNFFIKMSINGQTTKPFSAQTLTLGKPTINQTKEIVELSRKKYARLRKEVKKELESWEKGTIQPTIKSSKETLEEFYPEPII